MNRGDIQKKAETLGTPEEYEMIMDNLYRMKAAIYIPIRREEWLDRVSKPLCLHQIHHPGTEREMTEDYSGRTSTL